MEWCDRMNDKIQPSSNYFHITQMFHNSATKPNRSKHRVERSRRDVLGAMELWWVQSTPRGGLCLKVASVKCACVKDSHGATTVQLLHTRCLTPVRALAPQCVSGCERGAVDAGRTETGSNGSSVAVLVVVSPRHDQRRLVVTCQCPSQAPEKE